MTPANMTGRNTIEISLSVCAGGKGRFSALNTIGYLLEKCHAGWDLRRYSRPTFGDSARGSVAEGIGPARESHRR